MSTNSKQPVVVTWRGLGKLVAGQEAVTLIDNAAKADSTASNEQKAVAAATMAHVLKELGKAEAEVGALGLKEPVLTTPHDGPASRFQTVIASGEAANLELTPLSTGGLEAQFDTDDWIGWAQVAWEKLKHLIPHPMRPPPSTVPEPLLDGARIAVIGDWGTGLYGAPKIAEAVRQDKKPFHMLLHLGDVYYSGTDDEVQERFLDVWPFRAEAVNRALNSNHEMYSGGEAYFEKTLKRFNQPSSYFAQQNEDWTLVGLDVAYHDHAIDDRQVDWLKQILAQAGDRKVVLFSHHQLYSHFESQGDKLWNHPEFGKILRNKQIFAWYWGHEHRCSIFENRDKNFGLYGRCIGHSGMPQSRKATMGLPKATDDIYQHGGDWRRSPAQDQAGNPLPSCVVLEGPNLDITDEEEKFTPHGYAILTLDGKTLKEEVLNSSGEVIYSKTLES